MRKKPRTLLFDLDGTMVDTDALHLSAYNQLLAPFGRHMDPRYYKSNVMGFPNDRIMTALFPDHGASDHAAFAATKEQAFRASIDRLEPLPGLLALLDWADSVGSARAVVTNAPRDNAELMLRGLGLTDRFPIVIIGEELAHGKPHPLPYITALLRTATAAEDAVVFEDSLSGVRSATAAGIYTVGMLTSLPEDQLRSVGARDVAVDFRDPALSRLIREGMPR